MVLFHQSLADAVEVAGCASLAAVLGIILTPRPTASLFQAFREGPSFGRLFWQQVEARLRHAPVHGRR